MFPSSSTLNFLGGLFAATSINIITSLLFSDVGSRAVGLMAVSLVWLAAALFAVWCATIVDSCRHDADLLTSSRLEAKERRELYLGALRPFRRRVYALMCLSGASCLVAVPLTLAFRVQSSDVTVPPAPAVTSTPTPK